MKQLFFAGIGGILFGFGLAYSGAAIPEVVLGFLQLKDFGLVLVLGIAIAITFFTYTLIPKLMKKPIAGKEFNTKKTPFSAEVMTGAILFGVGWGISGLCPGTALAGVGMGNYPLLVAILFMFLGTLVNGIWRE